MEGKKQNKNKWQWQPKQLEGRPGKEAKRVNEVDNSKSSVFCELFVLTTISHYSNFAEESLFQ